MTEKKSWRILAILILAGFASLSDRLWIRARTVRLQPADDAVQDPTPPFFEYREGNWMMSAFVAGD